MALEIDLYAASETASVATEIEEDVFDVALAPVSEESAAEEGELVEEEKEEEPLQWTEEEVREIREREMVCTYGTHQFPPKKAEMRRVLPSLPGWIGDVQPPYYFNTLIPRLLQVEPGAPIVEEYHIDLRLGDRNPISSTARDRIELLQDYQKAIEDGRINEMLVGWQRYLTHRYRDRGLVFCVDLHSYWLGVNLIYYYCTYIDPLFARARDGKAANSRCSNQESSIDHAEYRPRRREPTRRERERSDRRPYRRHDRRSRSRKCSSQRVRNQRL
jgi:hypothetical protein